MKKRCPNIRVKAVFTTRYAENPPEQNHAMGE